MNLRRWIVASAMVGLAILGFAFLFSPWSPLRVFRHQPGIAAQEAEKFADAVFVDRNFNLGFTLSSKSLQKHCPLEQMTSILEKMHPTGYPSTVHATEYMPIPRQPAMNILLVGENSTNEKFYYRLFMEGTQDTGYRVSAFFRGNGPFPPSPLRMPL